MAKKSITVIPKSQAKKRRGPGRPATGKDPLVALRLPPATIKTIDDWAAQNGVASRSQAMRVLIEKGLAGTPVRLEEMSDNEQMRRLAFMISRMDRGELDAPTAKKLKQLLLAAKVGG
jgi:hypothetical protein